MEEVEDDNVPDETQELPVVEEIAPERNALDRLIARGSRAVSWLVLVASDDSLANPMALG